MPGCVGSTPLQRMRTCTVLLTVYPASSIMPCGLHRLSSVNQIGADVTITSSSDTSASLAVSSSGHEQCCGSSAAGVLLRHMLRARNYKHGDRSSEMCCAGFSLLRVCNQTTAAQ